MLRSRGVQEKMSMLIVPVSGHVCRTACDSRRISTQVMPGVGKDVRDGVDNRRAGTAERVDEQLGHLVARQHRQSRAA